MLHKTRTFSYLFWKKGQKTWTFRIRYFV